MAGSTNISIARGGVSLLLIIIAIVLFLVSAFGVGDKLGFNLVDLGFASFAGAFIFG